jgi:DNA-binding protein H-NS
MQIDKQQILEFLQQQGDQNKKQQADQELPQQVDTDNQQHQNLLQKLGINPQDLISKFAGGKFGL